MQPGKPVATQESPQRKEEREAIQSALSAVSGMTDTSLARHTPSRLRRRHRTISARSLVSISFKALR